MFCWRNRSNSGDFFSDEHRDATVRDYATSLVRSMYDISPVCALIRVRSRNDNVLVPLVKLDGVFGPDRYVVDCCFDSPNDYTPRVVLLEIRNRTRVAGFE